MRSISRRVVVQAVAGLVALSAASCSQGSATRVEDTAAGDANAVATVRYMNFSANDGHEKDLQAIATAFTAANPKIKVQIETVPYADYFTKLQTSVAGGTAADTFELNYENFVTYAKNGSLAPLEGVDAAKYKKSLLDAFTLQGKQYGLPQSFSNVVLFYNKTLFDKAGVAPPTADWTWVEEKAAAEKLTNKAAKVWGDYQPVTYNEFYKALAQSGGQFLNADATQSTFDSQQGQQAAE